MQKALQGAIASEAIEFIGTVVSIGSATDTGIKGEQYFSIDGLEDFPANHPFKIDRWRALIFESANTDSLNTINFTVQRAIYYDPWVEFDLSIAMYFELDMIQVNKKNPLSIFPRFGFFADYNRNTNIPFNWQIKIGKVATTYTPFNYTIKGKTYKFRIPFITIDFRVEQFGYFNDWSGKVMIEMNPYFYFSHPETGKPISYNDEYFFVKLESTNREGKSKKKIFNPTTYGLDSKELWKKT